MTRRRTVLRGSGRRHESIAARTLPAGGRGGSARRRDGVVGADHVARVVAGLDPAQAGVAHGGEQGVAVRAGLVEVEVGAIAGPGLERLLDEPDVVLDGLDE